MFLKAINSEVTSKDFGKVISTNKIGVNKGLNLKDFKDAVGRQQVYSFEVLTF